jgi:hypothetical protein
MKISTSTVTKIVINDIQGLDPISLYLEDYAPGAGKVIITCWSDSWSYYWGHMGEKNNLAKFLCKCSNDYLTSKLLNGRSDEEPDLEATQKVAKTDVIKKRRQLLLGKDEARELFDLINEQEILDFHVSDWGKIFGEEFWYQFKTKPSTEYKYLCRILDAVRLALSSMDENAIAA